MLFVWLGWSAMAQPANDDCANAIVLPVADNYYDSIYTLTGSTVSVTSCSGTDNDVWFRFTATASQHLIRAYGASGVDVVVNLRSGTCSGTSFICRDNAGAGGAEFILASGFVPGTDYHLRISYAGTPGDFSVCVVGPPDNDDCAGARELTISSSCNPTNRISYLASQSQSAINCNGWTGNADDDTWYYFVANDDTVTVEVDGGSDYDPVLEYFTGGCGSLTSEGCADNTATGGTESLEITGLTIGDTIWVRTYYYAGCGGAYSICASRTLPGGPGDNCSMALLNGCGDTVTGNSYGLQNFATTWSCLDSTLNYEGNDVFYDIEITDPDVTTLRVFVDSVGDATDNYMMVMLNGTTCSEGQCDDFAQFVLSTQAFYHNGQNYMDFSVTGAGTYSLILDSDQDSLDYFSFRVECLASGIQLDTSGCGEDTDNDGLHLTWQNEPIDTLFPGDSGTLCMTYYVRNELGWEWLKYVDVTLGDCWTQVTGLTPAGAGGNYDTLGTWAAGYDSATHALDWTFTHSVNPNWGDGEQGVSFDYDCYEYQFCFDAVVDIGCTDSAELAINYQITDDGIGGTGNSVASNHLGVIPFLLPVEYGYLTGEVHPHYNLLKWSTLQEVNNDYFVVERSQDGQHFTPLGKVDGAGNHVGELRYQFKDQDPVPGVSYYRLRQFDLNGEWHLSDIIALTRTGMYANLGVKVSPNPFTHQLIIGAEETLDHLSILNATGQIMWQTAGGRQQWSVETADWPAGYYMIRVTRNGIQQSHAVVKP